MRGKTTKALAAIAVLSLSLAACGGGGDDGSSADATGPATGSIDYWLWDSNQLPMYQKCADAFKAKEGVEVKITQKGWDDYWSTLTTGMQSGTAPDVFTDHVSKYPEFVTNQVILPLDDLIPNIDPSIYAPGLAELWVAQDGKRYGLPKDWDTVALFYNKKLLDKAGVTEDEVKNMTWNPNDGGSFEKILAKLTVDKNGKRGDEAGFDPKNIAVYGWGMDGSGTGIGQTQWAPFTAMAGWTHTDKNPWGTHYNYDQASFQQVLNWWRGLIDKGYMPGLEQSSGMTDNFAAGKMALNEHGSWMTGIYAGYDGNGEVDLGIAPLPTGPSGKSASMFNGLADSIWSGTDNKAAAAKWVAFLGSEDCQKIVADSAVVFPAIKSLIPTATDAFKAKGVDVTPFTSQVDNGTTFLFPITEHAADVTAIMQPAMEAFLLGNADAGSFASANDQVNALFQ